MTNPSDVTRFLQAVFGKDHAQRAILANLHPSLHVRGDPSQLSPGRDCYWSVGAFAPGARTNKDKGTGLVLDVRALVIDDVGTKISAAAVELALGSPTAVVETSAGNQQWSWRLEPPVTPADWPGFFAGVEALVNGGRALDGSDAVHLFRLPMGVNTKPGRERFPVHMVSLDPAVALDSTSISRAVGGVPDLSSGKTNKEPPQRVRDIRGLVALLPENHTTHNEWVVVGERIKALALDEEEGREAFHDFSERWSRGADTKADIDAKWDTFKPDRTRGQRLIDDARSADPLGFDLWMQAEAGGAFDDGAEPPPPAEAGADGGAGVGGTTHVDMAEALVAQERGVLGWLSNSKGARWGAFDPVLGRWVLEDHDALMRAAVRDAVHARRAAPTTQPKLAKAMAEAKWRGAVQGLLVRERRLMIPFERFDADPDMFGVPGGVVRLVRGSGGVVEESGAPTQMVSKATAVRPAGASSSGVAWDKFLDEFTDGDLSLREWWQCFMGYCLTGRTHEHTVVNVYGGGENGKSVFLDTVGEVMGPYHQRAGHATFTASTGSKHMSQVAGLVGARLVTVADVQPGAMWDMVLLKALTGGGKFRAQFMREDWFEFEPAFKLVISCNDKLLLPSVDKGVRRRFLMVPAKHDLARLGKKPNKHLKDVLRREHGAILRWMLDGWRKYDAGGLPACAAIERETKDYLEGSDTWGQWRAAAITVAKKDKTRHRITDLWDDWNTFRQNEGNPHCSPVNKQALATKLREEGFIPDRDDKGSYISGVSVTKTAPSTF